MNWIKKAQEKARVAQEQAQNMANLYNKMENNVNTSDYKGDFYGMLGQILSSQLKDGAPDLAMYRQNTEGAIKKGYNQSQTKLKESFAERGMGGSGAALAAQAQLGGEFAESLGQNEVNLSQMDMDYKRNALAQLLNLNSVGANANLTKDEMLMKLFGMNLDQYNFERQFQFQKDNQPSEVGQFFGNLVGGLGEIATAGFMSGTFKDWFS